MLGKQKTSDFADTCVYVFSKENYDMQGAMIQMGTGLSWRFKSLFDLMQIFEKFYNTIDYPQHTHNLRSISDEDKIIMDYEKLKTTAEDIETVKDREPTFIVRVKYRQNASWQGTLDWLEGGKSKNFRSTLELIKLMDSAMGGEQAEW